MNFKKTWKRFFSLSRASGGFTLVELIVVIAILAILAGVGVPAYSGYVEKANKQADISLISDIEHALTLAGYNGTFADGAGGYITLSATAAYTSEQAGADTALNKALTDAFGANYSLQLKYAGWPVDFLTAGLSGAKAVYESSYYDVSDQLMGQVKELTDAAWNILGNDGKTTRAEMLDMFDGYLKLDDLAQMYDYDSFADVPDDALPNLMVLAIATDVATKQEYDTNDEEYNPSKASGIIQNFALYNAYASTEAGKTADADGNSFAAAYATFIEEIEDPDADYASVAASYNKLKEVADGDDGFETYAGSQGPTDSAAFSAMMQGLVGAAMTNKSEIADGLTQSDFYTNGFGSELFNTYIGGVEAAANIDPTMWGEINTALSSNKHAVFFSMVNNKIEVGDTLLTD